ncbi:MAG: hypothetical protein P8J33_12120 [Pirellulaceae bacterium]|nr:hypothetical protein [Pirellulaceae bacterium]
MKRRKTSRFGRDMEKWFQSIALIRRVQDGKNLWLARESDRRPDMVDFIAAPRLESESFRETIRREVGWVLDLDPKRDLLVSNMAQLNLEFVASLPNSTADSHIAASFFLVEIYGRRAMQKIESDPANRWMTSGEVCSGDLETGETVDPRLLFLLDRAKVINAWD